MTPVHALSSLHGNEVNVQEKEVSERVCERGRVCVEEGIYAFSALHPCHHLFRPVYRLPLIPLSSACFAATPTPLCT